MLLHLSTTPRLAFADGSTRPVAALDAALLAWLALEGPTPRARLAGLLWPDKDGDSARNSLRQRLFQLRRSAGVELVSGSATLSLAEGVSHDLVDADTVLGEAAGEDLPAGEFAQWLEAARARRRERKRRALAEHADAAEAARDWDDALGHAHEMLALEPLSEEAHRRLMRLHYLRGDRAAALLAFDACERVLKDDVGAQPSAETLAVLRTIEQADSAALPALQRTPASILRPPRLIGREPQWQMLRGAWQAGQCAIVIGEAGLGKTRLATDFAQTQGRALVTGARPGDARVVYASLSRLLRGLPRSVIDALDPGVKGELARLLPELGEAAPLATETERTRFFNAVASLLDSPSLAIDGIVFDDLHFADDASVELLQYVSASPLRRWIVGARGAEVTASGRALLDGFDARGDTVRIELSPLTLAQIEEFIASLDLAGLDAAALAPALARHTGGNPLFLLETLKNSLATERSSNAAGRSLRLPASRNVAQLIEQRIGRLSSQAVQLARCAAVAAPDFSIELASQVLGLRTIELADPWAELEVAQVLRDGAFAHDLIYESALASVPRPVARRLHAEIATYLDLHEGEPARVAAHWLEAGDDAHALDALQRAARKAAAAMRKREEVEFLQRAADVAERLGRNAVAFGCLAAVFTAQAVSDRAPLDDVFFARLDRLADNPDQRLLAALHRADIATCLGRFAEGATLAEAAAEMARSMGRQDREVDALRGAAACASHIGDSARAVRLLRPALPWVLEHAALPDRQSFFNDFACCLDNADEPQEAQRYHRRALDLATQLMLLEQAATCCANLTYSLGNCGRMQAAFDSAVNARRYAAAFDELRGATVGLDLMTLPMLRDLARYSEALRASEVALHSVTQHPAGMPAAQCHLASLWLQLGQPARAHQALAAAQAKPLALHQRARYSQLLGRLQQAQGQAAGAAFEQAMAEAPITGRTVLQSMVALDHASTLPADAALAACEGVIERCDAIGYAGVVLAARIRAAGFAIRAAEPQRAATMARLALDTPADIVAADLYRGELWQNAALAFEAAGDLDGALVTACTGRDWVRRTAEEQVPAEFRDGFLHRNPVNRELLALAARLTRS